MAASSLFYAIFGKPRVAFSTGKSVGDVTVILPNRREDPLFNTPYLQNRKRIQIGCPREISIGTFKKRIAGVTGIPDQNIRLTFEGTVLGRLILRIFCNDVDLKYNLVYIYI